MGQARPTFDDNHVPTPIVLVAHNLQGCTAEVSVRPWLVPLLCLPLGCSDYALSTDKSANDEDDTGIQAEPGWDDDWEATPTDGAAQIQVLPDPFDFGEVAAGCADGAITYFIRNVGDADLDVYGVTIDGAGADLTLGLPAVPATLAPMEWISGELAWAPLAEGTAVGTVHVTSSDALAPDVVRPLSGTGCIDSDGDGLCDGVDDDRDGDGIANTSDDFPDHLVIDDAHVDFDSLAVGTRVAEQYASTLGIHFLGGGDPGEGYDSNVVNAEDDCTLAVVQTSPNVLCTYVNDGFNTSGDPGIAGWLDQPADAVRIRLYNAGLAYAVTNGRDADTATLYTYDSAGNALGTDTAMADTDVGEEYVDLQVLGADAMRFDLYTGDFDAIDDLHVFRLAEPSCE